MGHTSAAVHVPAGRKAIGPENGEIMHLPLLGGTQRARVSVENGATWYTRLIERMLYFPSSLGWPSSPWIARSQRWFRAVGRGTRYVDPYIARNLTA